MKNRTEDTWKNAKTKPDKLKGEDMVGDGRRCDGLEGGKGGEKLRKEIQEEANQGKKSEMQDKINI